MESATGLVAAHPSLPVSGLLLLGADSCSGILDLDPAGEAALRMGSPTAAAVVGWLTGAFVRFWSEGTLGL